MRFSSVWARVLALLAGLVLLIAAFWMLTTAADLVDDERIVGTLTEAQASGTWNTGEVVNDFGYSVDRYTECVAFTQGLGTAPDVSTNLGQSMADVHLAPDGCGNLEVLLQRLADQQQVTGTPYFRYWHGYAPLPRPLLAWTDVQTLRTIVAVLLVSAFCVFVAGLVRTAGVIAGIVFSIPLVMTTDLLSLPASATHSLTWTVILASAAAALYATRRWGQWGAISVGLYAGALFAFIDLLTNPPAALMMLLVAVLTVLCVERAPLCDSIVVTVWAAIAWSFGYVVTWFAKWFISALEFGFAAVDSSIRGMIAFRISGSYGSVEHALGAATRANWQQWLDTSALVRPLIVASLLASLLLISGGRWRVSKWPVWLSLYLLISAIPVFWYELLSNHSQIHAWFTYRSLGVSLAVVLTGAAVVSGAGTRRPSDVDGAVAADDSAPRTSSSAEVP